MASTRLLYCHYRVMMGVIVGFNRRAFFHGLVQVKCGPPLSGLLLLFPFALRSWCLFSAWGTLSRCILLCCFFLRFLLRLLMSFCVCLFAPSFQSFHVPSASSCVVLAPCFFGVTPYCLYVRNSFCQCLFLQFACFFCLCCLFVAVFLRSVRSVN